MRHKKNFNKILLIKRSKRSNIIFIYIYHQLNRYGHVFGFTTPSGLQISLKWHSIQGALITFNTLFLNILSSSFWPYDTNTSPLNFNTSTACSNISTFIPFLMTSFFKSVNEIGPYFFLINANKSSLSCLFWSWSYSYMTLYNTHTLRFLLYGFLIHLIRL